MLRDGEWTIETMLEMIKDTSDFEDQGVNMNTESQWGALSEGAFLYSVYLGTGSKLLYSDGGTLITPWADDTTYENDYEIFEKLIPALYGNNEINFVGEKDDVTGKNYGTSMQMFANGQALFYTGTLSGAVSFRGMKDVFGILPVPKYTEEQEFYYSWCSTMAHTPLMVPATVKTANTGEHVSRTATIIEGMAYFSKYMSGTNQSVLDAFYENMTYSQLCREPEDYEMLELIFSQKTFDLDYALNLANYCWKVAEDVPANGYENYSLVTNLQWYRGKLTGMNDQANKLQEFLDKYTEAMDTLYPEG